MDITYLLPADEVNTLEQIRNNHEDYSTRQRAGLVLLSLMDRSIASGRQFSAMGLMTLVERYKKYGFSCLLPNWDLKHIHAMSVAGQFLLS